MYVLQKARHKLGNFTPCVNKASANLSLGYYYKVLCFSLEKPEFDSCDRWGLVLNVFVYRSPALIPRPSYIVTDY